MMARKVILTVDEAADKADTSDKAGTTDKAVTAAVTSVFEDVYRAVPGLRNDTARRPCGVLAATPAALVAAADAPDFVVGWFRSAGDCGMVNVRLADGAVSCVATRATVAAHT